MRYFFPVVVALFVSTAHGHHSRSAFDLDDTITIDGTVTEVGWTNPHYYLAVREDSSGEIRQWTFEGHSIPGLVRNGWSRNTLAVGSRVSVLANPNRDHGVRFGLLNSATRRDGKTFHSFRPTDEILNAPKPPLEPSVDFSGTWKLIRSLRSNLVGGFEPPSDWPLTDSARGELVNFDINDAPSLNCEPRGVPRMLNWPYSQKWQHEENGVRVEIEHAPEVRRFYTSQVEPLPESEYDLGQARIMHRDNKVLVVKTSGFSPKFWGLTRGVNSGAAKEIIERYELIDNGYRMKLTVTMDDPVYLLEPVEETLYYAKVHDFEFAQEPDCDVVAARRHLEFEDG